jgi:streptomycin 6-kinase
MSRKFISNLPRKFTEVILGAFRDEGRCWLESLPQIIGEIEQNWSLKISAPFENLSYHYVAPCTLADKSEAVVKIGFHGEAAYIRNERKMLEFLNGRAVNRLLRFDEKRFAFLLEKLSPGENLKTVCAQNDKKAVEIAIEVMRSFWQKPPENNDFPTLEGWFDGLKIAEKTDFDFAYTAKARHFFEELNSSPDAIMLLHGDFHHENILSAERAPFLAIDPKGIVGHKAYDLCAFLLNHVNWLKNEPDWRQKLTGAIEQFGEAFEIEPRDLRRWVFAHSVLSAWWTFDENCENWKNELEFTKIWEV